MIYPMASFADFQTFLKVMGWEDIADTPFAVEQGKFGAPSPYIILINIC